MVTTTGGRGDVDLTAPAVGAPDGDDIVVMPDGPATHSRGRLRAILVGAIVVVLVAAGITVALAGNHHNTAAHVRNLSVHPAATHPARKPAVAKTPTRPKTRTTKPKAGAHVVPTTAVAVAPVSPPPVTQPTAPAVVTPPVEPTSVLSWSATPNPLSIKAGGHATVTVTVTNPTDGTVTLGTPLSCSPSLQPVHGAPIGGLMCEQMAQVMSPHQTLTQQYTIYATGTADASGRALTPGAYGLRVENLYSIPVTITAS